LKFLIDTDWIIRFLNVNRHIGKIFAEQRVKLRKKNKLIDNFDLLIGSTALYYNLQLLTNNVKHFERIENLEIRNIDDFL
jgi:predicted nucleic acid-binding protein